MTWSREASKAPTSSGFNAKDFFVSFLYGMGAFMGIAAFIGAVMVAYLVFVVDRLF